MDYLQQKDRYMLEDIIFKEMIHDRDQSKTQFYIFHLISLFRKNIRPADACSAYCHIFRSKIRIYSIIVILITLGLREVIRSFERSKLETLH